MKELTEKQKASLLALYGTDNPADIVLIDIGGGYIEGMLRSKAEDLGLMDRVLHEHGKVKA